MEGHKQMGDHTLEYIMLTRIQGIGPVTQNRLLDLCGSISACFELSETDLKERDHARKRAIQIGSKKIELFLKHRTEEKIYAESEEIINTCLLKNIDVITPDSREYPGRFLGVPDKPVVLYTRGLLKINEYARSIGIVGARRCSAEGKQQAVETTVKELQNNSAIISGMAKGIDSYAHTAAIKNGGYTIAVLGNGPDLCYPAEHDRLYDVIVTQGCILSEYPPGTKPRQYSFPKRNRLIAALSDELYVIDTGRKSGTQSTIDNCKKYGKLVESTHFASHRDVLSDSFCESVMGQTVRPEGRFT